MNATHEIQVFFRHQCNWKCKMNEDRIVINTREIIFMRVVPLVAVDA